VCSRASPGILESHQAVTRIFFRGLLFSSKISLARKIQTRSNAQEDDYSVTEIVPDEALNEKVEPLPPFLAALQEKPRDSDARSVTLKLEVESLKVHHIKAVAFDTQSQPVRRYRRNKSDEGNF
jgi:hypothetical protein